MGRRLQRKLEPPLGRYGLPSAADLDFDNGTFLLNTLCMPQNSDAQFSRASRMEAMREMASV